MEDREERRLTRAESMRQNLAYQIREMRKSQNWTQDALGKEMGKPQSVVSRLEDPEYGRFSLQTLEEAADAFDVYLLVRFVRFSRFAEWATAGWPDEMVVPPFEEDYAAFKGQAYQATPVVDFATRLPVMEGSSATTYFQPHQPPLGRLLLSVGSRETRTDPLVHVDTVHHGARPQTAATNEKIAVTR